jgi:hypothetical protein
MTENTKELQRVVNEGLCNTFHNPERDFIWREHTSLSSNILGQNMHTVKTDSGQGVDVNTEEGQEMNMSRFSQIYWSTTTWRCMEE